MLKNFVTFCLNVISQRQFVEGAGRIGHSVVHDKPVNQATPFFRCSPINETSLFQFIAPLYAVLFAQTFQDFIYPVNIQRPCKIREKCDTIPRYLEIIRMNTAD